MHGGGKAVDELGFAILVLRFDAPVENVSYVMDDQINGN